MSASFSDFRAFESVAAAESVLGELLQEANIPYHIHTLQKEASIYTGDSGSIMNVWLQIQANDFDKVNKMLEKHAYQSVNYDKAHFLNALSDAELRDILYRYDEWNAEEYVMARKILESRGHTVSEGELSIMRANRLNMIRQAKPAEPLVLILGYVLILMGGFFSVMIGWSFYSATKTDPEGKRFYVYDKLSRQRGKDMIIVGTVMFLLYGIWLVYRKY